MAACTRYTTKNGFQIKIHLDIRLCFFVKKNINRFKPPRKNLKIQNLELNSIELKAIFKSVLYGLIKYEYYNYVHIIFTHFLSFSLFFLVVELLRGGGVNPLNH